MNDLAPGHEAGTADAVRARTDEIHALDALEAGDLADDLRGLLELAVGYCGVSSAAVNIITEDQQHQVVAVGLEPSVCTAADSMCNVVLDQPTVAVGDAREDPRFRDNPFVDGRTDRLRFYASSPLVGRGGVVIGRLCVFDRTPRDVTGDKEDALHVLAGRVVDLFELRRRARELEASNARLSDFASQVGHDLRSPLTAMLFHLQLAMDEPLVVRGSVLHTSLTRCVDATRRMSSLIEGILRSAHDSLPVDLQRVDLGLVLLAVLEDLAAQVEGSGASVSRGDLHVVDADAAQMHSLLLNLMSNALKFTRPGHTARVHVASYPTDRSWVIEVSDRGSGVPIGDLERVFNRYERGDRDGVVAGDGIGLTTARRIADAHGGTLELARRDDGPGTVARVVLPRAPG